MTLKPFKNRVFDLNPKGGEFPDFQTRGKSNGVDSVGEEMWETDPISGDIMPAYLVQYEGEHSELVLKRAMLGSAR